MSTTVHGVTLGTTTTFCDLPECVDYCAEIILSGVHAGQIALNITDADNEECEDTYYGCYDFATGKWEVEIPDGCCGYSPCSTDVYFKVNFSGINKCSAYDVCDWVLTELLGTEWELTHSETCPGVFFCDYGSVWTITAFCYSTEWMHLTATFLMYEEENGAQCMGEEVVGGGNNAVVFSKWFNPSNIPFDSGSPLILQNSYTISDCEEIGSTEVDCKSDDCSNNIFERVGYGGEASIYAIGL